jgi:hypothetical protein
MEATIHEPATTITDYILFLEGGLFAFLVFRVLDGFDPFRRALCLFLSGFALTAFLGGTVHGFFPDESTTAYQVLWRGTLLALGVTALAGWWMGAALILQRRGGRILSMLAVAGFAAYAAVVLFWDQTYLVAVMHYLPATVFLLIAFALTYFRTRSRAALSGTVGVILTFVAAGIQTAGIGIHPVYFDHNALYHVVQGIAIVFVYLSGVES